MSHIFISYSRKNQAYARALANELLRRGFDVWIDDRIDYGDDWQLAIFDAIERCGAFLPIMTKDAWASKWVRRECQHAEDENKAPFPLLLEGKKFPFYNLIQYVDVRSGTLPPDDFFARLEKVIKRKHIKGTEITSLEFARGSTVSPDVTSKPEKPDKDLENQVNSPQRLGDLLRPRTAPTKNENSREPETRLPIAQAPTVSPQDNFGPVPVFPKTPNLWALPLIDNLLSRGTSQKIDHTRLLERAHTIEETLERSGAPGRVVEIRYGPVVAQFGVEPDYVTVNGKKMRVKSSAIVALDKDIQMALGVSSVRMEAPVPGKGYIGIELPNDMPVIVHLRDVLESSEFKKIDSRLALALGQSVDGIPVAADLTTMPHLFIAGMSGSGRSVFINSIIASLILKNSPTQVKLIMVDPERTELMSYNGVPHLIAPVVTELKGVSSVLKWVTREMDERYRRFSTAGARHIMDFNKHLSQGADLMPYIVVIINELADLMMFAPDETERRITRIAALARATGIHLVIATQRPSIDVVTGLIKANFPARIAFAVASVTDSRVIVDQPGADRLLGRGDMLYMNGESPSPLRLQGVFISDSELTNLKSFWRDQIMQDEILAPSEPRIELTLEEEWKQGADQANPFLSSEEIIGDDGAQNADETLYNQAVVLVRRENRASVSLLQRKLRIGYTRAVRLIDLMEERGIIGPAIEGAKPREVLPSPPNSDLT